MVHDCRCSRMGASGFVGVLTQLWCARVPVVIVVVGSITLALRGTRRQRTAVQSRVGVGVALLASCRVARGRHTRTMARPQRCREHAVPSHPAAAIHGPAFCAWPKASTVLIGLGESPAGRGKV